MNEEKATITVKVDVGLKITAQNKADALGINLSQVTTQSLRDFLETDNYTFHEPTAKVQKLIDDARAQTELNEPRPQPATVRRTYGKPRKLFSFYKKGLKRGDIIRFVHDERITAKVINDRDVEFEGRRWKLSPLAKELHERIGRQNHSGVYQGPAFFKYKTVLLMLLPDQGY